MNDTQSKIERNLNVVAYNGDERIEMMRMKDAQTNKETKDTKN